MMIKKIYGCDYLVPLTLYLNGKKLNIDEYDKVLVTMQINLFKGNTRATSSVMEGNQILKMPNRYTVDDGSQYKYGWNDCIDQILGEE